MSSIVALVSQESQHGLVRYLQDVGFAVRSYRTPRAVPRRGTLVWLTEHGLDAKAAIDAVRLWLGDRSNLRAILVSDRPMRLRMVAADPRRRVHLLPAPVFRWQLVDSLRAAKSRRR
jgi:hypothetical protein